jgi:hypothetical protein
VAQSVLTLPHSIPDGKTMDSPEGKLKIEQSQRAREENFDP